MNHFVEEARILVLRELPQDKFAVFVFGSRAGINAAESSDLDIGILGNAPLTLELYCRIKSVLEDSTIPYKVDVVDFYTASQDFKNIALKNISVWNCPKNIIIN